MHVQATESPRVRRTAASRRAGAITVVLALGAVVLAATLAGGASAAKGLGLCSQIDKYQMTKQMNMHASQVLSNCGRSPARPGKVNFSALSKLTSGPGSPLGADVNVVDGGEGVYPHVVQSETFNAVNGNTVVSTFNDSALIPTLGCVSGGSVSTNGGATFTTLATHPFCTGHGSGFGDPIVVYNQALGLFFAGDLVGGGDCGGQGIGLWTSPNGTTWSVGGCAHVGSSDDRESMAVDNNPASPHYGRMYVSWNDFATPNGDLDVVYSDNGTTWFGPTTVFSSPTFMRDVQLTAARNGNVFLAGMDEGGGGFNPRQNHMFRSTNGGASFIDPFMGPPVPAAGESACGYFTTMFSVNPYWRDMGWGNPAASIGSVVNYVFTQNGGGADLADVMYTRSTDNGLTWSVPVKIDGDTSTTRKNWRPAISQSPKTGDFLITWYDQRATSGNDYQLWGRRSTNNGASFGAPFQISDVTSPLPQQNDPSIQTCYAGDYDMPVAQNYVGGGTTLSTRHFVTWVDGRVALGGSPGSPYSYVTSTSTGTVLAGGTDTGNHCDDCSTAISLPFPEEQYGTVFTTATVASNGSVSFGSGTDSFANACLPTSGVTYTLFAYWDDQLTTVSPDPAGGIFTQTTGSTPNRDFHIRWHTIYYGHAGTADYEVVLHENSNVETVIYGASADNGVSATAGIQFHSAHATQFSCNTASLTSGLRVDYNATGPPAAGTPGVPQQDVFFDKFN